MKIKGGKNKSGFLSVSFYVVKIRTEQNKHGKNLDRKIKKYL